MVFLSYLNTIKPLQGEFNKLVREKHSQSEWKSRWERFVWFEGDLVFYDENGKEIDIKQLVKKQRQKEWEVKTYLRKCAAVYGSYKGEVLFSLPNEKYVRTKRQISDLVNDPHYDEDQSICKKLNDLYMKITMRELAK